jgi:hypothetical protein
MKRQAILVLGIITFFASTPQHVFAGVLFGTLSNHLYDIDPATGTTTQVSELVAGGFGATTLDPIHNVFYGTYQVSGGDLVLAAINTQTGTYSTVTLDRYVGSLEYVVPEPSTLLLLGLGGLALLRKR